MRTKLEVGGLRDKMREARLRLKEHCIKKRGRVPWKESPRPGGRWKNERGHGGGWCTGRGREGQKEMETVDPHRQPHMMWDPSKKKKKR